LWSLFISDYLPRFLKKNWVTRILCPIAFERITDRL
jgi:hypothetical protein